MFKKRFAVFTIITVFLLTAISAYAAVDNVRCIVWQGDPAKFHTAISGQSVRLKGVITTTDTNQIWYKWVYGDGTESAVSALSGNTKYSVSIDKVYTGAEETPFTAMLLVDAVDSSMANAVSDTFLVKIQLNTLDARVNIAIDNGLWWLYNNPYSHSYIHTYNNSPCLVWRPSTGSSYGTYFTGSTASTVQAFAINNHKVTGDTTEDPYVESVQLGMNWLIQGYYYSSSSPMLNAVSIGGQPAGDPDTNGNGYGIQAHDYSSRMIYQGGQVMDAIIASGFQPTDLTGRDFSRTDGEVVKNWTYGELLQDMCDMYAGGQVDSGSYRGGWRYSWNYQSDNSAAQWAAIGMIPAQEAPWNCVVPDWVKTENNIWLNTSDHIYGFGYTGSGYGYGTNPSGMVQLSMDGYVGYDDPSTTTDERDTRWINAERYITDRWSTFINNNYQYGWYAFAKAMRTALPNAVERVTTTIGDSFDWYNGSGSYKGMAQRIVEIQHATGMWSMQYTGYGPMGTAWNIIILRPALFKAAPVACFDANPNPAYPDMPIMFDPTCSDHSETGKDIGDLVLFEWDWDEDGVYDESTATPEKAYHAFSCANVPCVYPVTLRVTDDEGLTATASRDIEITNPPHPPVADAGGPYMVSTCAGDSLTLDGSGSYDINEGDHEDGCPTCPDDTITAWDWDIDGAPFDYTSASGETATISDTTSLTPGVVNIGLRVTDNTELAFPGSGEPDLTDEDFSSMEIYDGCICDLAARAKLNKIQLTWVHTGAASYDIYRSEIGPNGPFELIADDVVTTYATYLDSGLTIGTRYYYRVVTSDGCGSNPASATPAVRTRR